MEVCLQTRKTPKNGLRRKVKTGCRTCKIRRVKCDEGKPICSRCRTTGRICDGYGVCGGGGNTYAERYAPAKQQPQKPLLITIEKSPTKTVAIEELRYLQLFRLRFIHTVSGWFGTYFWTQIVLPATALEPAILHAVIALSAAHRCEFQESLELDVRERFMLQQYSRAMQLLQSMIQHQDRESIKIVLVACQIFTFLEYLRGRPTVAEAHLLNGLRLLGNVQKGGGSVGEGVMVPRAVECKTNVDRGIVQRFATLHIQASLFGRHLASTDFPPRLLETEISFPTFSSVDEAKDLLDDLLQRVLLLTPQFQHLPENVICPSTLLSAKEQVISLLTAWLQTYHRTTSPSSTWRDSDTHESFGPLAFGSRRLAHGINTRDRLAYLLLLNYHAMARIMAHTLAPGSPSEARYAAHTADFLAILEGSIEIWKTYALAREIPGNVELANSIGEFGPTPPLYFTAVKCRVSRIRRHAVRLMGVVGYKEAVWDTALVASVAGKVVELEEGGRCELRNTIEEEFSLHEVPRMDGEEMGVSLPETSLFHDVKVDIPEESAARAVVTCKRWSSEGRVEVLRYQLEGERWDEV